MKADPASLENLRDIAVPPSVPWWPPAPGWWVLLGVLMLAAVVFLSRAVYRWKTNAYRRAALRELQSATRIAEIAEILKRTALCAYPRLDIASLSGSAWCQWLGETGQGQMPEIVAIALTRGVFGKTDSVDIEQVSAFAAEWIEHHRIPTEAREGRREG